MYTLAVAMALGAAQAPPPPYFLTGYQTAYQVQAASHMIPGAVMQPEQRMFRILPRS